MLVGGVAILGVVLGVVAGFGAAILWAFSAVVYRKGLEGDVDSVVANCFRAPLGFVVLFFLCLCSGKVGDLSRAMGNSRIMAILLIAVFIMNIVGDILYLTAIQKIGVSMAYPLSYTYPLAVALISSIILGLPIHYMVIVGTSISLVGIYVMSSEKSEGKKYSSMGILAALGASFSWAVGIVIYSLLVLEVDPIILGALKLAILILLSILVFIIRYTTKILRIDTRTIYFILLGGLLGVGLGDLVFYISLYNISASIASALTTSAPFLSQILACVLLGEKLTKNKMLGTSLIVIGLLLVLIFVLK